MTRGAVAYLISEASPTREQVFAAGAFEPASQRGGGVDRYELTRGLVS